MQWQKLYRLVRQLCWDSDFFSTPLLNRVLGLTPRPLCYSDSVLLSSAVTQSDQVNSGDFGMFSRNNQKPASLFHNCIMNSLLLQTLMTFFLSWNKERLLHIYTVLFHTIQKLHTVKYLFVHVYDRQSYKTHSLPEKWFILTETLC